MAITVTGVNLRVSAGVSGDEDCGDPGCCQDYPEDAGGHAHHDLTWSVLRTRVTTNRAAAMATNTAATPA